MNCHYFATLTDHFSLNKKPIMDQRLLLATAIVEAIHK